MSCATSEILVPIGHLNALQEKVLARCHPPLQPALKDLRDLFFKPGQSQCAEVVPEQFEAVVQQHLDGLLRLDVEMQG